MTLTPDTVTIIEANLPDPPGWRFYAATPGRKFVTLIALATGERVKLGNDAFGRVSWRIVTEPRILRRAAKRLEENAPQFKNDHVYVADMVARIRKERREAK